MLSLLRTLYLINKLYNTSNYHTYTFTETVEVQEDTEKQIKGDVQPKKKHSVEITEITELEVDKKPTEEKKEESVENVEENRATIKKVTKIRREKKKDGKKEVEIKEIVETEKGVIVKDKEQEDETEVEIEEILDQTRDIKKKIKLYKPRDNEYEIDEEDIELLKTTETPSQKQLPLNSSRIVQEAFTTGSITHINESVDNVKADIEILSHTAIIEKEVHANETEKDYEGIPSLSANANRQIDNVEAIQISEQSIHIVPGQFDESFKPDSSSAHEVLQPHESIQVEQITLGDTSTKYEDSIPQDSKAILSILPQEAKTISETEVSLKEKEFIPATVENVKPLQINTSAVYSEATSISEVSQMNEDVQEGRATVDLLPHAAVVGETVYAQEQEKMGSKFEPTTSLANKSIDTIEAFEITETTVQSSTGEYASQPKPSLSTASTEFVSNEGLIIREYNLGDISKDLQKTELLNESANITVIPQEAKNISDVYVSQNETELDAFSKPTEVYAQPAFSTKEGINVEEVQQAMAEEDLKLTKPNTVKPKYNIEAREPLTVEEVLAEDKPGKYLPEAFVATEIASKSIIPQKSLLQTQTVAPELEGEYVPGRLPPSQTANFNITTDEGVIVSQTETSEKENLLEKQAPTESAQAVENIILSEGISVSAVETQQPQNEISSEPLNLQQSTVDWSPLEPLVSQTTFSNEKENQYEQQQLDYKSAESSYTFIESSSQTITTAHESEKELPDFSQPTQILPEISVSPNEPITIEEIETSELPDDFKSQPTFKTDVASVDIETQEATNITETHANESETNYEGQQKESYNVESSLTRPLEEVSVTESQILEMEQELTKFVLPDSKKIKHVSSNLLPLGVTEETMIEHSVDRLKLTEKDEGKANVQQSVHSEVVTSEAVASENIENIKDSATESKQATQSLLPNTAINILEVHTDDKEKPYVSDEAPEGVQATSDISTRQVASNILTETHENTNVLKLEHPEKMTAVSEQETLNTLEIIEHQTAEKEKDYVETKPEGKNVVVNLTEFLSGANISQVLLNEKEETYETQPKPLQVLASQALTTQEVIITSEIESVVHADFIEEQELPTGRAKKYTKPFDELIVTETNVTDVEKLLPKEMLPYKKQANVEILPDQAISITEIEVDQREENLKVPETEKSSAHISIDEQNVAINEQVLAETVPTDLEHKTPDARTATTSQDVSLSIVQMEITAGEKEADKLEEIIPDKKQANVEISEAVSLNITEVTTDDKEHFLPATQLLEGVEGKSTVVPYISAVTEEIVSNESMSKFDKQDFSTEKAKPDYIPIDSLTTTESISFETENILTQTEPSKKQARREYEAAESLSVTAVTTEQKEQPLVTETPELKTVDTYLIPQDVVEVQEVFASDNIDEFKKEVADMQSATKVQLEHQSLINIEPVTGERESTLTEQIKPLNQTAEINFENLIISQTSEVIHSEKESKYETPEAVEGKSATTSIDVQPVAETTETLVEESTRAVIAEDSTLVKAEIEQTPLQPIVQTKPFVEETESYFDEKNIPSKSAEVFFIADQSITVTQTVTEENETNLKTDFKPESFNAEPSMDTHITPLSTEHNLMDTVKDITVSEPVSASAQSEIPTLPTAVLFETITSESESLVPEGEKPKTQEATVLINEDQTVTVETTMIHENETDFLKTPMSEIFADTTVSDARSVVLQSQPTIEYGLDTLETQISNETKALESTIPYDSVIISEQTSMDIEREFTAPINEPTSSASISIDTKESVTLSEEVLAQKEGELSQFNIPESKHAQSNIDVQHKVAEQTENDIIEATGIHKSMQPEESTATQREDILNPLIISENTVQENEIEFTGTFKPTTTEAHIGLDEKSYGLNITELTIQEKVNTLESFQSATHQKATLELEVINVPETAETYHVDSLKYLTTATEDSTKANIETIPHQSLIEIYHQIQEKESEYLSTETSQRQAQQHIDMEDAISSIQVITGESEKPLDILKQPESASALSSILENTSSQTTEVLTHLQTGDVKPDEVISVKATPQLDASESLTQDKPLVIESTSIFEDKIQIDTKNALEILDTLSGVTVSEVRSEAVAPEFKDLPELTSKAEQQIDAIKPLEASEIIANENLVEIKPEKITHSNVNVERDTFESVIQTENIIHEREKDFSSVPLGELKTAETSISQVDSLKVTEVITREDEIPLKIDEYEEKKSEMNILPCEPLTQSQVVVGDTTAQFEKQSIFKDNAKQSQDELESIIITEKQIHETEKPLEEEKVETKTINIEFSPEESLSITETIANELEDILLEKPADRSIAEKSFTPQEATQITEIKADQNITDIDIKSTEGKFAVKEHVPHKPLNVTETILNEKETEFEQPKIEVEKAVDVTLEKPGGTAEITEILSSQSEFPLEEVKHKSEKATSSIIEHIVPENEKIGIMENIANLILDKKEALQQATSQQDILHGVIETDILVNATAEDIKTSTPVSSKANESITVQEGIEVTEILTHGQTGDEIKEVAATETTAKKEIQHKIVGISEETTSLQTHDILETEKLPHHKGQLKYVDFPQHEIVVNEQTTTDYLESLESLHPTSKTVKVIMGELTPSLQISEVLLQEQEGKFVQQTIYR